MTPGATSAKANLGAGGCRVAVAHAGYLLLEVNNGHDQALLLLVDVIDIAGERTQQLFQPVEMLGQVIDGRSWLLQTRRSRRYGGETQPN
jgi:hypothetical protein